MNRERVEETCSTLLEISGHHIDKDQMRRELEIAERTSDGIEERRKDEKLENYDIVNLSAAAIGLLFSSLMMIEFLFSLWVSLDQMMGLNLR